MSIPRSRSPHYRRLPLEEPGFDPHRPSGDLDGISIDRRERFRKGSEEIRENFSEDMYPEGQRRAPPFTDDHRFERQPYKDREEFHHRRLSPRHDVRYEEWRFPPVRDGGFDGDRRREGFREEFQNFENRSRSPPRFTRERLPPTQRSNSDQRDSGMGWKREEQVRDRWRFTDLSPSLRSDDQRVGGDGERGRRFTQGPNRGRQRENPHHERGLPFKRQRREMDDVNHPGSRNEKDFGEKGYSMEGTRHEFGEATRGNLPHGDGRYSGPLVIEHDHGIRDNRKLPRWERFDDHRDLKPEFDRQRKPRPGGSSEELFRKMGTRLDDQEDPREHCYQGNSGESNYFETRRSPVLQDRSNAARYGVQGGPMNHRGRGATQPARRRYNPNQSGRPGQPRNHPRLQQASQGYQDLPREEQRQGFHPVREDYDDDTEDEPNWAEKDKLQQWEQERPRSLERPPGRDLDPKMPHLRQQGWSNQKANNMTVLTEETLTIKVDMSRPINQNSPLCYSSDRQLSLDLVNVGRQRLDFLPMLEHSGTYQETAMHTGTFAQEIITLVHLVKEQYFRGDGITLNQRFSAPQEGSFSEEEMEELTSDEGFESNQGFSLDMNSLLSDDKPLFFSRPTQGVRLQPVRGPGDLRHDLERRRQEKLEGVKVTIAGSTMSQRPLGACSDSVMGYSDKMPHMDHRRRDGSTVSIKSRVTASLTWLSHVTRLVITS
ncbi:BCLAF1 and THRAP3 family member 3 [Neolamprologus brichardi]|nr:BCLAF1 and THRAP3 family member 3 [Neolamprologus brichardi]